jgi:hypothetical protein
MVSYSAQDTTAAEALLDARNTRRRGVIARRVN